MDRDESEDVTLPTPLTVVLGILFLLICIAIASEY